LITPISAAFRRAPRFRGKYRLAHKICPRRGTKEATVFGSRVSLNLENYVERCMYMGVFEEEETRQARSVLRPGHTFVDAGANVGYYTLLASRLVGAAGRVLAFEPAPYALAKLRDNVARNRLANVEAVGAGLGEAKSTATLYVKESMENYTPSMVPGEGGREVSVSVLALDEELSRRGVRRVDLLKLDVEGYEPNVLRGAKRYLSEGRVSAVMCEHNRVWLERNGSSPAEVHATLTRYGFRAEGFDPSNPNMKLLYTRH
jgi:FkbM family methyltransferase